METFLGLSDGQWSAVGTIALVAVTFWYTRLTRSTLRASSRTADAAERSAFAAQSSARSAEQALMVTTTPVVVWSALSGKVNPANNPELDYRLHNVSGVAAFDISVAPVRYPVDSAPAPRPFHHAIGSIPPGGQFPSAEHQEKSVVIPGEGEDHDQWKIAVGNGSYGLIIRYKDVAGRAWRVEMRFRSHEMSLTEDRPSESGEEE